MLVILHQERSSPGRVGRALEERGYPLDIRKPRFGDPLPETLAGHSGAVIFGGPMSANDPDDYMVRETEWIAVPLAEERPFLGICLGAQMLVRHLGGKVAAHPEELVEIGHYPLKPTPEGARLMDWPPMVHQFHREWMEPPPGVEVLSVGPGGEPQAVRAGPKAYGVQFHAELTLKMIYRWTVKAHERLHLKGAQDRAAHLEGRFVHDAPVRAWLDGFLDLWLE